MPKKINRSSSQKFRNAFVLHRGPFMSLRTFTLACGLHSHRRDSIVPRTLFSMALMYITPRVQALELLDLPLPPSCILISM